MVLLTRPDKSAQVQIPSGSVTALAGETPSGRGG